MTVPLIDRFRGAMLGLACGDAVGTTLEFKARGSFKPITDMVGGGPFHLAPGQWTDDTSMALCLATSLVECQAFDAHDQMRRYVRWWRTGYLSSTGECFDIGVTIRQALARFEASGDPFAGDVHPHTAGNGSLMRLAPVVLFAYPNRELARRLCIDSSRTTHAAPESLECCVLLGHCLMLALEGHNRETILTSAPDGLTQPSVKTLATGAYLLKTSAQIRGSGYAVESLEAALWCFGTTASFEEAVLKAANLGDDADTTAAITGQIAGAFYGAGSIPEKWISNLATIDQISETAQCLVKRH